MSSSSIMMTMVQAAPAGQPGALAAIVQFAMPMVFVIGIFWILVWRPQQRQVRDHRASILAVKKGDDIVTAGGIRGRVTKVTDEDAEVEIAQGVRVRVIKSTISQIVSPTAKPAND